MKVGIFETEHFEGAYPVIKLFDREENSITVFSYPTSYHQFKFLFGNELLRYNWIIKEEAQSKRSFILLMYKKIKELEIDTLYLNTITDNHLLYALLILSLRNVRVVVTIHDVNNYFELRPPYSFKKLVRYLGKKLLLWSVKDFNVVSQTMQPYLQAKLPSGKTVHCIPGAVFETHTACSTSGKIEGTINIVVPGMVDKRRRNYDFVFDLLEICNAQGISINIVLLGGFSIEHGSHIHKKCVSYSENNTNLGYYDQPLVDQPEFDRVMNACHIVFIPSVLETIISDNVSEVYGLSIASGNLFDIIKHAKPFIAPTLLNVDHSLEQSCLRYQKVDDIVQILRSLIENEINYKLLLEKAYISSLDFTIEKVRERNQNLFEL